MPPRLNGWASTLCGLAVLTACAFGAAAQPPAKMAAPQPLAEEVVSDWEKAGAVFGWMRIENGAELTFVSKSEGVPGDLPAFQFIGFPGCVFPATQTRPVEKRHSGTGRNVNSRNYSQHRFVE
jgi:hypothetical protein